MMLLIALMACQNQIDKNNESDSDQDQTHDVLPDMGWEAIYEIPERPFDLSFGPADTLHISAQSGDKIYAVENDQAIALNIEFEEITALDWQSEALYYLSSNFGVTGSLNKHENGVHTTIATQSIEGTLFRWPIDLIAIENGWLIADPDANGLFHVETTGHVSLVETGVFEALAWLDGTLALGGPDGIWTKTWPNGELEKKDSRTAAGLMTMDGRIYAVNHEIGLFELGGPSSPIEGPARPSAIVSTNDAIYVADRAGRHVWHTIRENP